MSAPTQVVGQCRFCRCTTAVPCSLRNGDECGWATKRQDLCTNEKCLMAFDKESRAAKRARAAELESRVSPVREKVWAARRLGAGNRSKKRVSKARAV